jgi:hypothetical protein
MPIPPNFRKQLKGGKGSPAVAGPASARKVGGDAPVNRLNGKGTNGNGGGPSPETMARESVAGSVFTGNGSGGYGGGWGSLGGPGATLGATGAGMAGLYALSRAADNLTRVFGPSVYADMARDPAVISSLNLVKQGVMQGGLTIAPALDPDPDKDLAKEQGVALDLGTDLAADAVGAGPDGKPGAATGATKAAKVAPPKVDPEDEARKAKVAKAKEIAEFCSWNIEQLPEPIDGTLLSLLGALNVGCKLAEVTYKPVTSGRWAGKWALKSIRPKSGESWAFVVDAYGTVKGYLATVSMYGTVPSWRALDTASADTAATLGGYDFLPVEKCAVLSLFCEDGDPRGRPVLEPAYTAWNYKQTILPLYYQNLALFAKPKIIASPGDTTLPTVKVVDPVTGAVTELDTYTALTNTLANYANVDSLVGPPGTTFAFLQPSGNGEAFTRLLEWADRQIALGILQTTRATMEAEHGSKADSGTGQDNAGLTVRVVRQALVWTILGVLRNLVRAVYGDEAADELTPKVSLGGSEHQDHASRLTALAGAGFVLDESQFPRIDQQLDLPVRTVLTDDQKTVKAIGDAQRAQAVMQATGGVPAAPGTPGQTPAPDKPGSTGAVAGKVGQAPPVAGDKKPGGKTVAA